MVFIIINIIIIKILFCKIRILSLYYYNIAFVHKNIKYYIEFYVHIPTI